MSSTAQRKANNKYKSKNITKQTIDLNKNTDKDIITKLKKVGNKEGFIKRAIRSTGGTAMKSAEKKSVKKSTASNKQTAKKSSSKKGCK